MNFLAPLFLLGALAVAAPVIFHLIRRTTREKTRFSSLLFLQPDPPRLTQRSRIENWLLLLLRAAALALLALAFARPFIRTESPPAADAGNARRLVVLVDSSASMQRTGLTEAAREEAGELLRAAKAGDQVALWTFDATTRRLMDFAEWSTLPDESRAATALGRLTGLQPGWTGTHLGNALTSAAELLAEENPGSPGSAGGGEIFLITDLQEGSRLDGLQGWAWPQNVTVTPVVLTPKTPGNAGLALAPETNHPDPAAPPAARVRVWNAADSPGQQFQLGWTISPGGPFTGPAQDITIPPGQSRVVALPWSADLQSAPQPRPSEPQPNLPTGTPDANQTLTNGPQNQPAGADFKSALLSLRLQLKGDPEPFDNILFTAPPVTLEVAVHYFGPDTLTDSKQPLYFLNQALPQTRQVTVNLNALPPDAPVPAIVPGQPVLFFATGNPPPAQTSFLHGQLKSGRTVLLALTTPDAAPALAALAGLPSIALTETKPATYGMLSEIDFKHPVFAPFADPRFSDFTKIRFWSWQRFDAAVLPDSRVLAKFDSGDPALVEVPVGEGRLLVLAAGWQPSASQFALSSKFVPLLASLMEWSGTTVTPPAQFFAGQPVPFQMLGLTGAGPVSIRQPDGSTAAMAPEATAFTGTGQPGLYTASAGTLTKTFAVNLDPAESRTPPLPSDELERLGVPVRQAGVRDPAKNTAANLAPAIETESRQKLWRWIILTALAVLFIETLLAGLAARRAPAPGGSAV